VSVRRRSGTLALSSLLLAAALTSSCQREERRLRESASANTLSVGTQRSSFPPGPPGFPPPAASFQARELSELYRNNAWAVSEGKRLFTWYNCSGCHGRGGGGMGPPLMDDKWLYGTEPEQLFTTVAGGRPNGMPAFGARVPELQIWQLVAYVRSLSGGVPKAATPVRGDELSLRADRREPAAGAQFSELPR
jgi:cytochrome c oxidase cbb3-type subunit III